MLFHVIHPVDGEGESEIFPFDPLGRKIPISSPRSLNKPPPRKPGERTAEIRIYHDPSYGRTLEISAVLMTG